MNKSIFAALLLATLTAPASAIAQAQPDILAYQFKAKETVTVMPDTAYILYRSKTKLEFKLLREVDEAQRVEHEAKRKEEFEKLFAKWEKKQARYEKEITHWKKQDKAYKQANAKPDMPVKPTLETIPFPAAEMFNFVTVDGGRLFEKGAPINTYLLAVKPGTYLLYGSIIDNGQGTLIGTCLCMGTLKFEALAGQITDAGEIRAVLTEAAAEKKEGWETMLVGQRNERPIKVEPAQAGQFMPAKLSGLNVVPAVYRAGQKLPNFFGILIDRISALPGVLAYDRDRVVDLRDVPNALPGT
jgi:hypothetical protein